MSDLNLEFCLGLLLLHVAASASPELVANFFVVVVSSTCVEAHGSFKTPNPSREPGLGAISLSCQHPLSPYLCLW